MRLVVRLLAVCAALALAAPAVGGAPRPFTSAPSEYVEVVPTAGGGVPAGANTHTVRSGRGGASAPGSAGAAAADAVGSTGGWGVVVFGAAIAAASAGLVVAAVRRRHAPNG
jgi:hypothetical protein